MDNNNLFFDNRRAVLALIIPIIVSLLFLLPTSSRAFHLSKPTKGKLIRWQKTSVPYYINVDSIPDYLDRERVIAAIKRSFQTWERVESSYLGFRYAGETDESCEFEQWSESVINVIHFASTNWPGAPDELASTRVSVDRYTGEILGSDIMLNAVNFIWSVSGSANDYDVENTLTHEIGHFIGLAHSPGPQTTMFERTLPGETEKRDLSPDDIEGISFLYPVSGKLDSQHEHDWGNDAPPIFGRLEPPSTGCAVGSRGSPKGTFELLALLLLLLALISVVRAKRTR